ncbi:hypothetical protein GTA07_16725, partial [Rhodococcus hoagii]|nr:hypothetical protein [Prescottella equi]
MQLIQQRLELGVGDFVTGRLGSGRHRLGRHFGTELALAMQLVEQRLEFGIGDVVTLAADR